jgi:Holliday junction resolvasome RuvABC DNA-binding subunit
MMNQGVMDIMYDRIMRVCKTDDVRQKVGSIVWWDYSGKAPNDIKTQTHPLTLLMRAYKNTNDASERDVFTALIALGYREKDAIKKSKTPRGC